MGYKISVKIEGEAVNFLLRRDVFKPGKMGEALGVFPLTYPEEDKILLHKFGSKSEIVGGFYVL